MRTFFIIWSGQLVSLVGSELTNFALSVWVYQSSKSVTHFALLILVAHLPGIVVSPCAGALVDRWDRRWTLLLCDCGAAISLLAIALLLTFGRLELWNIYLVVASIATFNCFQWPAYTASVTVLVPKESLVRASGMTQMSTALSQLIAPIAAGALLGVIHLKGVILVDFSTFLFALFTLLVVRIPSARISEAGKEAKGSLLREAFYGWTFIRNRPGLMALLIFFAITNFLMGSVIAVVMPMILAFASEAVLGVLMSVGGIGMLAGSVLMSAWNGPRRLIWGILGAQVVSGLSLVTSGLEASPILVGACIFCFLFANPILISCSQAIWQRKVPADIQGKVFAVRWMIASSCLPLALILSGPLADHVFEPLMAADGFLAANVGEVIGVGAGRGIALMLILAGVLTLLATIVGASYGRLRDVELELPDVNE